MGKPKKLVAIATFAHHVLVQPPEPGIMLMALYGFGTFLLP